MKPVPLFQVKAILEDVSSQRPLPREAAFSLQHAEAALKVEPKVLSQLYVELTALPYVGESLAAKIVDFMPEAPEEIRLLLPKDRLSLEESQIQAIMELLAKHR